MKKSKTKIVVWIVSMLFCVGTIGLLISMINVDKQSESITTFLSATVDAIKITDTGSKIYVEIHTKEYHAVLLISTIITQNIDLNDIHNLHNGQKIFFRVENSKIGQMNNTADQTNNVNLINIVSLQTETKDIFSIEEYNQYIKIAAYPARMAGVAMALLFLSISIINFISIMKQR